MTVRRRHASVQLVKTQNAEVRESGKHVPIRFRQRSVDADKPATMNPGQQKDVNTCAGRPTEPPFHLSNMYAPCGNGPMAADLTTMTLEMAD